MKKTFKKARIIWHNGKIPSDVLGSYTGIDEDGENPVQDVDDL